MKLDSLQVLRAGAALAVVSHHAARAVTVNRSPGPIELPGWAEMFVEVGAIGVDLFFILSGFLMYVIAGPYIRGDKSASDFALHRLIRIWPIYAVVTLGYCGLAYIQDGASAFDLNPVRLAGLVFVPSFDDRGVLQPIVGPGWTLIYEVYFYLIFSAALLFFRSRLLLAVGAMITIGLTVGTLLPASTAAGSFLGNPITMEFLLGGLVGFAWKSGIIRPKVSLALAALALSCSVAFGGYRDAEWLRLLVFGIPATAIFVCAISWESVSWPQSLVFIGNASYSIYLIHMFVVARVAGRLPDLLARFTDMPDWVALGFTFVVSVTASVVTGVAMYLLFEKPLLLWLRAAFLNRPTVPLTPAAPV